MSLENPSNFDFTTPVFLHHKLLQGGHDQTTPSATGTFVRYEGNVYLVTCGHVVDQIDVEKHHTLSVMVDRAIIPFSGISKDAPLVLGLPLSDVTDESIDIAVGPTSHFWELITQRKGKRAINLDNWQEPEWSKFSCGRAYGWKNEGKRVTGDQVFTDGIQVTVGLSGTLDPSKGVFTLFSENAKNTNQSLSGISGGALFGILDDSVEVPIGIVFEGYPGSENTDPNQSFFKEGDLMIRGHFLTPQIFQNWLSRLQLVSDRA